MVLVLLDAFLYVRAFLYEDDSSLVYPYGDAAAWLLFWFHVPLLLGNKKPASPFGGVGGKKKAIPGLVIAFCIEFLKDISTIYCLCLILRFHFP